MCVLTVDSSITSSRDLRVGEAAGDEPEHLALARRQPLEAPVARRVDRGPPRHAVDHAAGHRGREQRVAGRDGVDRRDSSSGRVRLSRKPEAPALSAPKM